MRLKKITDNDLVGKGVIGLADTPNLSARALQEKFEQIVREVVIPTINENVDSTVSKRELAQAEFESGSGDMLRGIYDTDSDGVVEYADNGIFTATHTKTGTVHNIIAQNEFIVFCATADYLAGDTVCVNGEEADVITPNGNLCDGLFTQGGYVFCIKRADKLYLSYPAHKEYADVFSLQQTKTNKIWLDGKPIYRRCIEFGPISAYTEVEIMPEVGFMTNLYGYADISGTFCYFPQASHDAQNNIMKIQPVYTASLHRLAISITGYSDVSGVIIAEYTLAEE